MIIKRDRYLKQVIDKKKNGMIKIVTGIRSTAHKNKRFYTIHFAYGVNNSRSM